MSFRQHKWTRWLLERSQESLTLLGQGLRAPNRFRDTLVAQAQTSNRTALSLLKTQKEWNDLRYYGLVTYLRRKMPVPALSATSSPFRSVTTETTTNTTTTSAPTTTTTTTSTPPPALAKVDFMVTGRMKGQLAELGYTPDDIKALTPVEASLLIDHDVAPADKAAQMPILLEQYEEQQQQLLHAQQKEQHIAAQQKELAAQAIAQQEVAVTLDNNETTTKYTPPPRSPSSLKPSWTEKWLGSMASKNVIDEPTALDSRIHVSEGSAREWFEVVEEYKNPSQGGGSYEVVALHSTMEDAQVDANLRLEINEKRAKEEKKAVNVQYKVRKTVR